LKASVVKESARIIEKMEGYPETILTCMTQHPEFVANYLYSWMLLTCTVAVSPPGSMSTGVPTT